MWKMQTNHVSFNILLSFFFQQMICPNIRTTLYFYILLKSTKIHQSQIWIYLALRLSSGRIVLFGRSPCCRWPSRLEGLGSSKYFLDFFHSFYKYSTVLIYILQSYANILFVRLLSGFFNFGFQDVTPSLRDFSQISLLILREFKQTSVRNHWKKYGFLMISRGMEVN